MDEAGAWGEIFLLACLTLTELMIRLPVARNLYILSERARQRQTPP
jgi:hypothetical protein